eukprot:scaffold11264_cov120-Isochrysis_galbana.AAC.2
MSHSPQARASEFTPPHASEFTPPHASEFTPPHMLPSATHSASTASLPTCSFRAGDERLSAATRISRMKLAHTTRSASLAEAASSSQPHRRASWCMLHAAARSCASATKARSRRV